MIQFGRLCLPLHVCAWAWAGVPGESQIPGTEDTWAWPVPRSAEISWVTVYFPSQSVCVCVCVCVSTAVVWGGPGQRIVTIFDSDFGLLVFSPLSSGIFMPAVRYQTRLLPTYSLAT